MKKLLIIAYGLTFAWAAFSQTTAVTTSAVNLRQSASLGDNILGVISNGEGVDITSCDGDWCLVQYGDNVGYVYKSLLKKVAPQEIKATQAVATSPVHYYTNANGNTIQSPTQYTSRPADATAQCRDGSYSFSQNHRGTCSNHGGVLRWF